ncbi:hypothetical protein Hanom_Chr03g00190121 [Helianthus anomalus]
MVDATVNEQQSFVLVGEATSLSYSFNDIIRLVQVKKRKRKAKEPEVMLLRWKEEEEEEEKIEDKELERILEDVDNYDPSWDDYKDDDEDQGSTGLMVMP